MGRRAPTASRLQARPGLSRLVAQRSETRAQLLGEERRLFPGREVPAFVELVVVNEFGIRALCPTLGCRTDLVWKDAHGDRDGDAFDAQVRELVLPVEACPGKRSVRQPGERDVVENVVACETDSFSSKGARDQRVAQCIVIEKIGGETDG